MKLWKLSEQKRVREGEDGGEKNEVKQKKSS